MLPSDALQARLTRIGRAQASCDALDMPKALNPEPVGSSQDKEVSHETQIRPNVQKLAAKKYEHARADQFDSYFPLIVYLDQRRDQHLILQVKGSSTVA